MSKFFLVPRIRALKDKNVHLFSLSFLGLNIEAMRFPGGGTYLQKGRRFVYISKSKSSSLPLQLRISRRKINKSVGRFHFGESQSALKIAHILEKARPTNIIQENSHAVQGRDGVYEQGRPLLSNTI